MCEHHTRRALLSDLVGRCPSDAAYAAAQSLQDAGLVRRRVAAGAITWCTSTAPDYQLTRKGREYLRGES